MDLKTLKYTPPWDWPEGASTVINDELVDVLLSIVRRGDEPENLRAMAVISLGPALEYADTDGFEDPDDAPITEQTFHGIQESLRKLYMDADVPKEVRRRILEASVRAPQDWHQDAIRAAYSSDDEDWKLTAVFSMRWVRGFDDQILEALENENEEIHYQAVCAAGNWEVDAAWSHVSGLVTSKETDKPLLLAAIEAVASIRPQEAGVILVDLPGSDDEDIVEAIHEAMVMAVGPTGDEFDDDEDEEDKW